MSDAVGAAALVLLPGVFALVVLGLGLLRSARELARLPAVEPRPLARRLTVVIPARNERERIGATLEALLADPSPELRVVVYDDRSSDDTAALVEEVAHRHRARLRLVKGTEEPADGFGKPLALDRAVAALLPRDDLLLFLDADVTVQVGGLGGLVAILEEASVDAVSGAPHLECRSVLEQLLVPAFVSAVGARFPPSRVNDDTDPLAFLNGQVCLVRREALDDAGGWAAVRHTVLEDVALARLLKGRGRKLRVVDLREAFSTRMYTSWPEIRAGFGKNAVEIHGSPAGAASFGLFAALVSWAPWMSLAAALAGGHPEVAGAAGLLLLGVLALQMHLREKAGVLGLTALANPVTYLLVLAVYGEAALRAWRGGSVEWRGRRYAGGAALPTPPSGATSPQVTSREDAEGPDGRAAEVAVPDEREGT